MGLSPVAAMSWALLTMVDCCLRRERQELRAEALVRHDGRADFQTHRRAWCASPFCLFKHIANENVCGAAAVKSYPYKELAEWVQGATMIMHLKKSEKKEMISCA